jgi:hypothetical protein
VTAGPPTDPERGEGREALLTYVPAVLAAFAIERALVLYQRWPTRRALVVGAVVGIVIALLLQRRLARRDR